MAAPTPRENWQDRPHASRFTLEGQEAARALEAHRRACEAGAAGYVDPGTGLFVLTARFLRERGSCCDTGCRHCPWIS